MNTNADVLALVLAAGRSSRVAASLGHRSKVLVEIGGETVLERNLRWLARSGITSAWINLHYRPDDVRGVVGDGARLGMSVRYNYEPELLGTAGAFRALASQWNGTVVVVYGDNVSDFNIRALLDRHRHENGLATIALFDPGVTANSGIAGGRVTVRDGRVVEFCEGSGREGSFVNAGVYALEPAVLSYVSEIPAPDFGRDVFPALLAEGRAVAAYLIEPGGYCFGIDTPESLERTLASLGRGSRRPA